MHFFSVLSNNKVTVFFTRFCIYGLMAVMLVFFGLGKIKDSHETVALESLKNVNQSKQAIFTLITSHIAVLRSNAGADYYRELASDQLGSYQEHALLNWTVDLKSLLANGTLPIELYFQTQYDNGTALQNFRIEGVLNPILISQSVMIE